MDGSLLFLASLASVNDRRRNLLTGLEQLSRSTPQQFAAPDASRQVRQFAALQRNEIEV
jgi:hypothetical protein